MKPKVSRGKFSPNADRGTGYGDGGGACGTGRGEG